jgi:hypothetical protein
MVEIGAISVKKNKKRYINVKFRYEILRIILYKISKEMR